MANAFSRRKEKATAGVFSAGFRLGEALDIAADVYHGVSASTAEQTWPG
jgi:hypothetical protein